MIFDTPDRIKFHRIAGSDKITIGTFLEFLLYRKVIERKSISGY
jgi:hypothetical protein